MNGATDPLAGLRAMATAALFPVEGSVALDGLREPVSVRRDTWGVPYIEAASLDDLWFAHGVVTAGERLFQLELTIRAANGRLSELFGDRTLDDDRLARTVGFHRAGARIASGWDERSRRMHERFRAGVRAWVADMPAAPLEYTLLDTQPWIPDDEAAWASAFVLLAWGLSGNWDTELLRAWIGEAGDDDLVARLLPPPPVDAPEVVPGALAGALFDATRRVKGQGSNAWAVAGSRTTTGAPLLANDPHLLAVQPGVWFECHLSAPGYRARGVALTFSPGVLLGCTDHHAWGVTNVGGDVQDLFEERLNGDRSAAEHEGAWEPLTMHREEINVRGEDEARVVEVRESRHGPLLDTFVSGMVHPEYVALPDEPVYALSWVGLDQGIRPSLVVDAAAARSFDDFRAATLEGLACPGQNVVYADVDGTIGYACTGRYPVRGRGEGTSPVPGWTGDHEWTGWVPVEELPWGVDPERGFLVSANHRMHDESYPHLIGNDFHTPFRARRIAEVLAGGAHHDVTAMEALQTDVVSVAARENLELLLAHLDADGGEADVRDALMLLGGWDAEMASDSAATAVYQVWCSHIARLALAPTLGDELFDRYHAWREPFQCRTLPQMLRTGELDRDLLERALVDAFAELRSSLGDDATSWRWGDLHRVRLAHPLAAIPGFEALFVALDAGVGGDDQTVLQTGVDARAGYAAAVIPSWRAVYDLGDLDRSVGVLPTGESGNPASSHWSDQAPLWLAGRTHALAFSEPAVDAAAVSEMRLVPGTISD
ncbi:MAG: penicillin acylase family protein [Actinomycetota bacterium]|nr:penicillin acylase family protein [Actinomycetota bacterium]MDH5313349.1 penicillin acylase family protein [Actinomycetota bacterium]